jgi:hypothetical protein
MLIEIGQVEAIFRYPVKSMRGEPLEGAQLGWHGLEGDRRLAFRRIDDCGAFPFLTAGKRSQAIDFTGYRKIASTCPISLTIPASYFVQRSDLLFGSAPAPRPRPRCTLSRNT